MNDKNTNIASDKDKISFQWWVLLVLLLFSLLHRLGYLELNGEEPRRAVVAWEMLNSGNFLVPHVYGLEYYNKPPLYNWLIAGCMYLFGTSEFVVRIPGILSFLSIGGALFYWLKKEWGLHQALLAAFIFWTSADLILYATVYPAELDLAFTFFMVIQAIGIYRIGKDIKNTSGYAIAYGALTLALFTKGWIALPFHLLALIFWSYANGQLRKLVNFKHLLSVLGFIAIILLYYWRFSFSGNLTLLLLNNFIESTSKVSELSFTSIFNQVTECPFALLKISLPWTIVLFAYFKRDVRNFLKSHSILFFSVIYILSNIWVYWLFIDVRDRYLYSFIPFMCILIVGVIVKNNWWPAQRKVIVGLMAIMITLRILYGMFILPRMLNGQLSNDNIYRELVDTLMIKTNNQPIDILAPLAPHELPFSYKGITSIDRPPVIPYQIPFYIIQRINYAPKHTNNPIKGKYYLALKTQTMYINEGEVLYNFKEAWYGKDVVLIKY